MRLIRRPGTGPALVALHGFAGTGSDWKPILEGLPNELVLPDLPGHGATADALPEDFDALADSLADLGLHGRAVWVGYSFGARCLWAVALRRPETVAALVFVSAHPGLSTPSERLRRRQQDEADARLLETKGLAKFLDEWHGRPVFASRRESAGWDAEIARKIATNDPRRLAACLRRFGLGAQPDVRPQLGQIRAPTLWVTGALDDAYTALARDCVPRIPRAEHVVLPRGGHGAHLEEPQAFQDVLRRFLGERERERDRSNP